MIENYRNSDGNNKKIIFEYIYDIICRFCTKMYVAAKLPEKQILDLKKLVDETFNLVLSTEQTKRKSEKTLLLIDHIIASITTRDEKKDAKSSKNKKTRLCKRPLRKSWIVKKNRPDR